jgi:uncharacterized protein (DUF305 family)
MQKNTLAQSISLVALAVSCLMPLANAQTGPAMGTEKGGMKGDMNKPMAMDKDKSMGMGMGMGTDMKPMMMDMQQKMSAMKSSGNVDVDFAMMMRVHHQSAITMAEAELQNGKDPQMRVMAKDIIYAQKKEIAAFDKFLAGRGEAGMKMGEPGMKMKK